MMRTEVTWALGVALVAAAGRDCAPGAVPPAAPAAPAGADSATQSAARTPAPKTMHDLGAAVLTKMLPLRRGLALTGGVRD